MFRKKIIIDSIALLLTIAVLTACSGPEQKKAKFYSKGKALYEKGEFVKANLEFKNAVQIDPKYADPYYMMGMIALKSGNPQSAYGKFSKAVELLPQHWGAQAQLGKFLLGAGKLDDALAKADIVLKAEPKNEEALILKGAVLIKKKETENARRFLEGVLGKDVRNPDGYLLLTSIFLQNGDREGAEKTLREGIKVNEKAISLYLALADVHLQKKEADEAVGLMRKVIEIEPEAGGHRLALAGLYWGLGKEPQAAETLKTYVEAVPSNEERWVQAASFYAERNRHTEAERQLKEGIRQNGKSFRIRFALSRFYLAINRPDQAVSILKECLGLSNDPKDPNILQTKNSLAGIYLAREENEKAISYVDEVIKESPKNVDANFARGSILLMKGEGAQAVSAFRIVVSERPRFLLGHIGLAEAHALNKETSLAFDTLKNALKSAPDSSRDITRAMARIYTSQKDFKNAESQYQSILTANPGDLEVRADLGDLMLQAGDLKRAEKEYMDIRRQAPKHPVGYMKMSALYVAGGKWDRAIAELEQALRINPNLWKATNDLAYLLVDYGRGRQDIDRALTLAEKARSLSPESASIWDTLGWVNYRKGEMNQAVHWLGKAQARNPLNPVINYHLGMAYFHAGNPGKAKEYLQLSLASKISFPGKDEAQKTLAATH
jgi:tetratricopeptide (TPR) repeat protein